LQLGLKVNPIGHEPGLDTILYLLNGALVETTIELPDENKIFCFINQELINKKIVPVRRFNIQSTPMAIIYHHDSVFFNQNIVPLLREKSPDYRLYLYDSASGRKLPFNSLYPPSTADISDYIYKYFN
jgi:hypothetical protein